MEEPQPDPVVAVVLENLETGLGLAVLFEYGSGVFRLLEKGQIRANGVVGRTHGGARPQQPHDTHNYTGTLHAWFLLDEEQR